MKNIVLPSKSTFACFCKETHEICAPLEKIGVTFFNYSKVYKAGARIDLCTSYPITEYYYFKSKAYKTDSVESNVENLSEGFNLWSSFTEDEGLQVMRNEFNTFNGISYIHKTEDYCECYHFGSTRENAQIIHFYLNHLDVLKLFNLYFKSKGRELIKQAEKQKIMVGATDEFELKQEIAAKQLESVLQELSTHKYFVDSNYDETYLTQRELECLCWYASDKTVEEIALILKVKVNSVKSYIEIAKRKMDCHSKVQLLHKMKDTGLIALLKQL